MRGWFRDSTGRKIDWGRVEIGVKRDSGEFGGVVGLEPHQYGQEAYEKTGGLVDLKLTDEQATKLGAVDLALRLSNVIVSDAPQATVAMQEVPLVASTDQRGIYKDADGQVSSFEVHATHRGGAVPKGTKVLLVKYQSTSKPDFQIHIIQNGEDTPQLLTLVDQKGESIEKEIDWEYVSAEGKPWAKGKTLSAVLPIGEGGTFTVYFRATDPGFPLLAFLPFKEDSPPPVPGKFNQMTACFTTFRFWPNDESVRQRFVKLWNDTVPEGRDALREKSFAFVYEEILYLYDMLYPVMLRDMPLGRLERIEGARDQLKRVLSDPYTEESTVFMPITRDLSTGKRWVLKTWADLMGLDYPAEEIK